MQTKEHVNNHQLVDYDVVLDAKFGKKGTASRIEAEEKALAFYTGTVIADARKQVRITQTELAERIGADKAYISRVESGKIEPKVSTFYRIMNAMGMNIQLSMSI
ncbi:MAG: helix-turn-helix domain-containing protein [Candidatus Symbiothrix sp.]|jgi:ribosome-binding protein aMBF1 (putative translation factor)|nr:helix-turn-helix domain-containing protein [Candidatus Symbiothrix sp.]